MALDKFTRMVMGAKKADVDSIRELKNYQNIATKNNFIVKENKSNYIEITNERNEENLEANSENIEEDKGE